MQRSLNETKVLYKKKAKSIIKSLENKYGKKNFKKITQSFQSELKKFRNTQILNAVNLSNSSQNKKNNLENILAHYHSTNVIMLQERNKLWPYEYMTFSRRIGELWEEFILVAFQYPVCDDLRIITPLKFQELIKVFREESIDYLQSISCSGQQRNTLSSYFDKLFLIIESGDINLSLDIHIKKGKQLYNIDLKSGFSSNEKGNTNRLLTVGSIYKHFTKNGYKNMMLVRSEEDSNNHYLQTLKNSEYWSVFCANSAYDKINELTSFNIKEWIKKNINWDSDFDEKTFLYFKSNHLLNYLKW